jgi:hypothetical protein
MVEDAHATHQSNSSELNRKSSCLTHTYDDHKWKRLVEFLHDALALKSNQSDSHELNQSNNEIFTTPVSL